MPLKIEVKSHDDAVKTRREVAARRVVDEFGNSLPDLRLLAFFDDADWPPFKHGFGQNNRGLYTPIKYIFDWGIWPDYVKDCILADDPSSLLLKPDFDHVIYLYGSTCAEEVGLIMTFSHELQHFIQYGFSRKLWAENSLIQRLPKEVIDIAGLNWPDIPTEHEARIVAKRIGANLCRADAVGQYIVRRIEESSTRKDVDDVEDWRFFQRVDPLIPYDLAGETKRIFQRLKLFRHHFEELLVEVKDEDFKDLNLAEYFDN